ncbi:MAG: redoxin domain-containing protein [Tissierellia bacterium]|nr:redoxin domain-containing protein [Tissierellia bacterium]
MRALELAYDGFIEKDIVPLGINVDHQYSKSAWGKVINISKLQMLSDYNPLGEVAKAFGIFSEEMNASGRANFLIDKNGKVQWVEVYKISEIPDFKEVLSKISDL